MANSNRAARRKPLRRIKATTDTPKVYREWLEESPRLKAALAEAERRFGSLPHVHGIGVGQKYRQSAERAGARPRSTLGLCVTIWVKRKVDAARIPPEERIPRYLTVNVPGEASPVRVMTDVVAVGDNDSNDDGENSGEESGGAWPTAGDVRPGARHTCSLNAVTLASGRFTPGEANLGTTGALIEIGASMYATTAAHTIISVSDGSHNAPSEPRGFGARGQDWIRIEPSAFFPGSIRVGPHIRDALLFQVPGNFAATAANVWPPNFRGRFATAADISAVLKTDNLNAFVWIERNRQRVARPCSVWQGSGSFQRNTPRATLRYSFVWMYRFRSASPGDTTKGGDSGAGVFIPAADGSECRLLGLHFFRKNAVAYAADAENFLRAVAGQPGVDFTFPGTSAG